MKTIYQATGMNLILVAVITIIGVSLFSAFKQSEESKKYLHMSVGAQIVIIDENNKIESVTKPDKEFGGFLQQVNLEMNNISKRGFKLVNSAVLYNYTGASSTVYTFEK